MRAHSPRVLLFLILALAAGALLVSSRPASAHLPSAFRASVVHMATYQL